MLFSFSHTTGIVANDEKIYLQRDISTLDLPSIDTQPKIHPHQAYFRQQRLSYKPQTRATNFNKLIAIMIEFPDDGNPNMTGNGKFVLEPDPDYPITLGAPPRNREFFEANLEAVKYYYRAASFEAFQLDYDVYPKNKIAYTMPHPLSYYHPTDSNLFIQRIEQYFKDAWETADADEDRPPSFADYAHFMIIHAGSSWQQDVFGDSPHDLPSFFIHVADGKEAVVDGGQTLIKHCANVPETISQDIREFTLVDGRKLVVGYGAVNGVFVHEFGHSLGFPDLYNTLNGWTAVGMFDIMDSGGSGSLSIGDDYDIHGNAQTIYLVEGVLPTLPSVWTRLIAWEDNFLYRGILHDLADIPTNQELEILASSAKRDIGETTPYFYRIRLSEDEYLLLENRNLDPDDDGGTALRSALNRRVMLHPDLMSDTQSSFTYEYDLLLPSWLRYNPYIDAFSPVGGGLLIWHIDDYVIHQMGDFDGDVFLTNFQLNRVNPDRLRRGVRIIEADGLDDIGNPYSRYWSGTEWEYFFRYKPVFDENGTFVDWSDQIHNTELSFSSKPSLMTNTGIPSNWKISNISQADRVMTFTLSNHFFDHTTNLGNFPHLLCLSDDLKLPGTSSMNIGIFTADSLSYFTNDSDPAFFEIVQSEVENFVSDFPAITSSFRAGMIDAQEFLLVDHDKISFVSSAFRRYWIAPNQIVEPPLPFYIAGQSYLALVFPEKSAIYKVTYTSGQFQLDEIYASDKRGKFVVSQSDVHILFTDELLSIPLLSVLTDTITPTTTKLDSSESFTAYEPVVYAHNEQSIVFIMSDRGNIYKIADGLLQNEVKKIFSIHDFSPGQSLSQLAIGYQSDMQSCFLLFYTTSRVFVITPDGAFYPGFPLTLERVSLQSHTHPFIFRLGGDILFLLHDHSGLVSVNLSGKTQHHFSQYWDKSHLTPRFLVDDFSSSLYMVYADKDDNVLVGAKKILPDDQILWNGYRNSGGGYLHRTGDIYTGLLSAIEVFVYPSPVRSQTASIKVLHTHEKAKVDIYNIAGQKVFSAVTDSPVESFHDVRFDTAKLSSGVYFVVVDVDGQIFRKKFAIIK
jgi:M6 family metalloprotease-like protein